MEHRPTPFDEALLSGYLDGELTQAEEQRVRLYIEDHPEARETLEEMQRMREASMSTEFNVPDDTQWDERPRGPLSFTFRSLGWLMLGLWVVGTAAFGLWQLATSPGGLIEKLLAFGALSGFGLLLLSVLLDRLRTSATDRYRRVLK